MKRGQESFSFGMIFSIILIVALLGVASYVIVNFINLSKCSQIALFKEDFQNRVNKAWASDTVRETFEGNLPSRVEFVCFGNKDSRINSAEYQDLEIYLASGNMFMYPPKKACGNAFTTIDHLDADLEELVCFGNKGGKVSIRLEKESSDPLVRIAK